MLNYEIVINQPFRLFCICLNIQLYKTCRYSILVLSVHALQRQHIINEQISRLLHSKTQTPCLLKSICWASCIFSTTCSSAWTVRVMVDLMQEHEKLKELLRPLNVTNFEQIGFWMVFSFTLWWFNVAMEAMAHRNRFRWFMVNSLWF